MSKKNISRRNFLSTLVKAAGLIAVAPIVRFVPESEQLFQRNANVERLVAQSLGLTQQARDSFVNEFNIQQLSGRTLRSSISEEKSAREVEADLSITQGLLYQWNRKFKAEGQEAFPGKANLSQAEKELRRLQRENEILRQEREILKKAVAITSAPLSTGFTPPRR